MSYLTLGLILLIGGMVLGLIAFSVAASNMGKSMEFKQHARMMIPMVIGGMASFVGVVFIILHIVERLVT